MPVEAALPTAFVAIDTELMANRSCAEVEVLGIIARIGDGTRGKDT